MPAVIVVLCFLLGTSAIIGLAQGVAGTYEPGNSPNMSAFLGICQAALIVWITATFAAPLATVLWAIMILLWVGFLINMIRAATDTHGPTTSPEGNFFGGLVSAVLLVWLLVVFL